MLAAGAESLILRLEVGVFGAMAAVAASMRSAQPFGAFACVLRLTALAGGLVVAWHTRRSHGDPQPRRQGRGDRPTRCWHGVRPGSAENSSALRGVVVGPRRRSRRPVGSRGSRQYVRRRLTRSRSHPQRATRAPREVTIGPGSRPRRPMVEVAAGVAMAGSIRRQARAARRREPFRLPDVRLGHSRIVRARASRPWPRA